jgi:asparagine synthase (glutamine-hydrolysing)
MPLHLVDTGSVFVEPAQFKEGDMSFLVVFNADRAPVDFAAFRKKGIDRKAITVLGSVSQTAFIQTDADAKNCADLQVINSEERFWIIGRVRLDDRERLCEKLCASLAESDARLCLRAYSKWGVQSPEHFLGDFCFVIWDESRQRLFCVRDQLGVRPFFYSQVGHSWFISDALDDIRSHANLRDHLDERWVVDFLIKGRSVDFDRSVYKDIKRFPPAHILIASSDREIMRRYWTLEIKEPLFYRDRKSYRLQFHELLETSIRDRLPDGRLGVSLSGGLDSSTLAAKAVALMQDASKVIADTRCFDHLIPDEERRYSTLVANRLGIQQIVRPVDDAFYDSRWYTREIQTPEPTLSITSAAPERLFGSEMAKEAAVWFYGEGPDNALTFEWRPYLHWLWMRRDWGRFAGAAAWCLGGKEAHALPAVFRKCASWWRESASTGVSDTMRQWLRDDVAKSLERSHKARNFHTLPNHWRPQAFASFASSIWTQLLEEFDPSFSGVPVEWRHPYLDLRVLSFLIAVPPIPWARRKLLIREAMEGYLPREVLARDKTPLVDDPVVKMLKKHPLPSVPLHEETRRFVDEAKVPERPGDASEAHNLLRLRILDQWLKHRRQQ